MTETLELLATCEAAARAGAHQLMAWRGRFSAREKAASDLVTDADLASQEAIRTVILGKYPDHGFLGEEHPDYQQLSRPFCWIVDPLDGTTNYVHDFPCYAVSVAVAQEGRLVAGAIFDPLSEEFFLAAAGQGAHLNGKPIAPSTATLVEKALVAVSFPPQLRADAPDWQAFFQVASRCQAVRRTGSAALNLAYVACGRLDAHWAHKIYPWDSAAGVLLVREAGGVVTASRGSAFQLARGDYFAAGTSQLHQALLPLIAPTDTN